MKFDTNIFDEDSVLSKLGNFSSYNFFKKYYKPIKIIRRIPVLENLYLMIFGSARYYTEDKMLYNIEQITFKLSMYYISDDIDNKDYALSQANFYREELINLLGLEEIRSIIEQEDLYSYIDKYTYYSLNNTNQEELIKFLKEKLYKNYILSNQFDNFIIETRRKLNCLKYNNKP